MASTVLNIVTTTLNRIGKFDVPSTLFGTVNQTALQAVEMLHEVSDDLLDREHQWQGLIAQQTITTVASQAEYALPSDYSYTIEATWWDRTNFWPMFGPATPQQWQELKSGLAAENITRRWFRMLADEWLIHPTPAEAGETIVNEYVSNMPVYASDLTTPKEFFTADADVPRLPERLYRLGYKWRFLAHHGLPYDEEYNQYERAVASATMRDGGSEILNLDASRRTRRFVNVPDTGFGA